MRARARLTLLRRVVRSALPVSPPHRVRRAAYARAQVLFILPGMRTYEAGVPLMLEELKMGRQGGLVTGRSSDCECIVS